MRRISVSQGLGLVMPLVAFVIALDAPPLQAGTLPIRTELIEKSVVFLFTEAKEPLGTGFLVAIPLRTKPEKYFPALVTARHLVDPQWAGCTKANPQKILLRVNSTPNRAANSQPGTWWGVVNLFVDDKHIWHSHLDERVDAVVIPLDSAQELARQDVYWIKIREFGSREEIEKAPVGIGDGVVSAGLLPNYAGAQRNYPVFKFGRVSSIPKEPLALPRCGPKSHPKPSWVWLLASNFVGGNSGSPVFLLPIDFKVGGGLEYKGPRAMLLGLTSASSAMADVGEMVPIEYVFEIIKANYPEADPYRGKREEKPKPSESNE